MVDVIFPLFHSGELKEEVKPNVIMSEKKNVIVPKHRWHFRYLSPLDTKHRTEERRRKEQLSLDSEDSEPPRNNNRARINQRPATVPRCHTHKKSSSPTLQLFQMVLLLFFVFFDHAIANTPPRFLIDGGGTAVGGDVIVDTGGSSGTFDTLGGVVA